jgi:hypothetical protein
MNNYISLAVIATCVTFSACNNEKAAETTKTVVSAVPIIPTAQNLHTLDTATIKSIAPDSIWSFKLTPAQIASLSPDQKNALKYAIAGAMANIVYTEVSKYEETGVDPDLVMLGMQMAKIDENYNQLFNDDEIFAMGESANQIVENKGAEARQKGLQSEQNIALNRAKNDSLDNVIAQSEKNIAQTEQETEQIKQERKKIQMQIEILKAINASTPKDAIASN